MPMTLSDLLTHTRNQLAEPDSSGRFSDAELTGYLYIALDKFALALEWPESYIADTTVASTQEYTLPENVLKILRVYVNGQPLVPTSLDILEGILKEQYDQSGGIISTAAAYTPAWTAIAAATYPMASSLCSPVPQLSGIPYRPTYYGRGANLGLIPPPSDAYPLVLAFISVPAKPVQLTDEVIFPSIHLEAVCEYAIALAKASDDKPDEAVARMQNWEKRLVPEAKKWKRRLFPVVQRAAVVPYRKFFRGGRHARRMAD